MQVINMEITGPLGRETMKQLVQLQQSGVRGQGGRGNVARRGSGVRKNSRGKRNCFICGNAGHLAAGCKLSSRIAKDSVATNPSRTVAPPSPSLVNQPAARSKDKKTPTIPKDKQTERTDKMLTQKSQKSSSGCVSKESSVVDMEVDKTPPATVV